MRTTVSGGQSSLAGVAIAVPHWQAEVDAWCDELGLAPPGERQSLLGRLGLIRPQTLSVTLVDNPDPTGDGASAAAHPPLAWMVATTDQLDQAMERVVAHGGEIISAPGRTAEGLRVAFVSGPRGLPVQLVELDTTARLAALRNQPPRRTEAHLRASLVANGLAALVTTGLFAHLAVRQAPHHQVSFAFLITWCASLAGAAAFIGYPNGLLGGEDEHGQGAVRTLRSEVAGTDTRDRAAAWGHWRTGAEAAGIGATGTGLGLGLTSFVLLGRPVGFLLLWGWSSMIGGAALVLSGGYGRRRGVLLAGRRAHGLEVEASPPHTLLTRVWLMGALPVAVYSAGANAGLAWVAYRWGVSSATLGSDLAVSVVVTATVNYLIGRQWGRADWRAGRVVVPADLHLPPKVRLGPQGVVFAVVAGLIALNLVGHLLSQPPQVAGAVGLRALGGLLGGGTAFALGAAGGVLNTVAAESEGK
ncbi:MAG: VOC family protein [Acidimicrobiales bacterium]